MVRTITEIDTCCRAALIQSLQPRVVEGSAPEHVLGDKEEVSRALCQPAHVPRIPGVAVADQNPHPMSRAGEPTLLLALDSVQHLPLEGVRAETSFGDRG